MASMNDNELQKSPQPPPPTTAYSEPPVTGIPVTPQDYIGVDSKPQAPAPAQPPSQLQADNSVGEWSTGLCDCFDDVPNCCITLWCPCITFGQISEIVDRGSTVCALNGLLYCLIAYLFGCPCLYSCFYRTKMRGHYRLTATPCNDCLVHCCCESCALCQEYRELKNRGFDMFIGWHGNVDKQNPGTGITMAPVVPGKMSRN